ncbi:MULTISPECIES: ribonuclease Z [Capnocytophaga]|uniref:ribonuclease Z n=1 Tax=Capnocytophaga TaxID=1016 RepID=UPI0037D02742
MTKEKDIKVLKISKSDFSGFISNFKNDENLKSFHLILDLLSVKDLENKDLKPFVEISKFHNKTNKRSIVIVNDEITYGNIPNEVNVTPTLQEAYDIIEMEEIQRDLGI